MTILPPVDRKCRRSPRTKLLPRNFSDVETAAGLHGTSSTDASFSGAVFNLSTTIVGAGIMALPATVKQLGLVPGVAMIILVAVLAELSIDLLLRFTRASKSASYAGVVADALGGPGRTLLQVCIVVNNLGMLIVYMIIIGDVLAGTGMGGMHHTGLVEEWLGQHWWTTRSSLLMLTTLLIFAPLISLKRVDSLRYTSAVSVGLAVVFVVILAGAAIVKVFDGNAEIPLLLPKVFDQASFWKLFTTVPIIVTSFICHHNIHPIENELKDPSQMKPIVRTSLLLCSSLYIATSFFGLLLFGDHTLEDVLANFDGDLGIPYSSFLDDIVRISYGVHLMLVFPIVFYSLRLNLDGLVFPFAIQLSFDNKRFFSITIALMSFIFLGATYVPNIWDAFQFTGATAAVSVGFIFPAVVALRNTQGIATKNDKLVSWLMMFLAISTSTVAVCSDLYSIWGS